MRCLLGRTLDEAMAASATQWASGHEVAARQWELVRDVVAHARKESAFYASRLDACGLTSDLTADGFRSIPPLSRREVFSSWQRIRTTAAATGVLHRRSGGSTGESVNIPMDRDTYCWYMAGTWRGLQWWGADLGSPGALVLGSGGGRRASADRARDWIMNWFRVPVDDRFDDQAEGILEDIAAFGPAFIYGYPSAVHRLARVVKSRGWRPRRRLEVIALTGEPVYEFQRRSIAEIFQCPVAEEYGNGELGCMAFQCRERKLHVTADNVFLEILPTTPAINGTGGLVLATQLRNRLFPLIRYETGDLGSVTSESCPCGRGLPTVSVSGRLQERLIGNDGATPARPRLERFLSALPEHLQGRVQVTHSRPAHIALYVATARDSSRELARAAETAAEVFGSDWTVAPVETARLARLQSGKLPFFRPDGTR